MSGQESGADIARGRQLCSDAEAGRRGFFGVHAARRRQVLRETLDAFAAQPPDFYPQLAARNLAVWRSGRARPEPGLRAAVIAGDWGDVAGALTRQYGETFAVLNMANAYVPGGAYVEGAPAQEENMFRRTDCHFSIQPPDYLPEIDRYDPSATALLTARDGHVYLDTHRPRVCIRGAEDRQRADLGYEWLPHDHVFSFYELRAAAQDLRDGSAFDAEDARDRIAAQFDTLTAHGLRHAVLSAFGCGAFRNPASQMARLYRSELSRRRLDFDVVAFAIFAPGYGPDNFSPFHEVFAGARPGLEEVQ